MNTLLHREGDDDVEEISGRKDREIHLGTTVILGMFLALAVLCAVFFAFGYSVGRKSVVVASVVASLPQTGAFAGFKPAAGSTGLAAATPPDAGSGSAVQADGSPAPVTVRVSPAPMNAISSVDAPSDTLQGDGSAPHPAPPAATAAPAVVAGASFLVQIAAVSHQEDADLLVTTLKRRGYAVAVHSEPQDKLLHVQVGPFASHEDAEAMRQRLLTDGFNALVKDTH